MNRPREPAMIAGERDRQERIAAEQFRGFYATLLRLRDALCGAPERAPPLEAARARVVQAIEDLGYRVDDPGYAPVDVGYVLTAVADEVVLAQCPEWAGHRDWLERPLEAVRYRTRLAGDRVFAAADDLVRDRRVDPRLATTILLALLTGFRGRYLGSEGDARIDALRDDLYALVNERAYRVDDPVPYATTALVEGALDEPSARRLPALWPWLVALALVVAAYLPVSHLLWWEQVRAIDALADVIVDQKVASPPVRAPAP